MHYYFDKILSFAKSGCYTSQTWYSLFDDHHIPIPVDLSFTFSINGFGTWWSIWKAHIFQKALGPLLQQIDTEYEASEGEVFPPRTLHDLLFNFSLNCLSLLQQQDDPELVHDELSFSYLPAAPVVLFYKNAPPCRRSLPGGSRKRSYHLLWSKRLRTLIRSGFTLWILLP